MSSGVKQLRTIVQEGIRVQRGSPESVNYVDAGNAISDAIARQNHVIFGRRGCGKTLLLHESERRVRDDVRVVYVNCEDYKQHSFPNVLIEILDQLFGELEKNLTGWFGKKKRSRELIKEIRTDLVKLKQYPDERDAKVRESNSSEDKTDDHLGILAHGFRVGTAEQSAQRAAIEREYRGHDSKIHQLNLLLPKLKERIKEFFKLSTDVKSVFLALDDFYHLPRNIQPHVADYVHRLCKDVPLYFKIATLRHASSLYADRDKQPIGVQERHDYQPINIDFTLADFKRTSLPLQVNLGSSDSDAFTYDPSTNHMTQYKFSVNGQSAIGNLTWNAMGTLETLGITDPFNSTDTQTCNYVHDDLVRIISANCGTTWSQTFNYTADTTNAFCNLNKSIGLGEIPSFLCQPIAR